MLSETGRRIIKCILAVQEMEARYTALEEEHHALATEKAKLQANSEGCLKASCCSCAGTRLLQYCSCVLPRDIAASGAQFQPAGSAPAGPASSSRGCAFRS